jgi:protein-S-isoprenylcysteine O-methyltransferase Ste14
MIMILEKIKMRGIHRISSGIDFSQGHEISVKRVLIKLLGLYFTIGLVAFCYWLLPHYDSALYKMYFKFCFMLLPIILIGSIPYFFILDKFMKEPRDGHWHVGMLLLGKWKETDKFILKNHFLGWVVKAFFLALMFPALLNNTGIMMNKSFADSLNIFPSFYDYVYNFIFSVDLVFVCAGYLLTLKIFDSHIRTVEPSILGWLVALQCYQPFWGFTEQNYLMYQDSYYWGHMIIPTGSKALYSVYGSIILILFTIYSLASVAFGLRFSNLTNRGIITNGPYRWMKHPAYIAKNLAWWMISVPFISMESWQKALQHSLLLLALNVIYYLRAVTEERHLSLDPTYVKYARALNEKGIFRGLYRLFPKLKYDEKRFIDENGKMKKFLFYA